MDQIIRSRGYSGNSEEVSSRKHYTYTSGNAKAGVIMGRPFVSAGVGGYAEAGYREGSKFTMSAAYGGDKDRYDTLHQSSNRSKSIELNSRLSIENGKNSGDLTWSDLLGMLVCVLICKFLTPRSVCVMKVTSCSTCLCVHIVQIVSVAEKLIGLDDSHDALAVDFSVA